MAAFYPANQNYLKSFQKQAKCLFTWSKQKWRFWRTGFSPSQRSCK